VARQLRGWDPLRAWRFIRASKAYRSAYAKRRPFPGLPERAPFPVRLRTAADAGAMRFGMMAWEDPYAALPLAPFWVHAGVVDATVTFDTPPLVRLAAEGGASLTGLRLDDGALMVRIESEGRAVQVRFADTGAFPEDGGLRLVQYREVETLADIWSGAPLPRPGRARGTAATASFCWRSRRRRTGSRSATTRCASGSRRTSRRTTTPAAGCTSA